MFVFYMFSQYPVNENKLFCIKTLLKLLFFLSTLRIDVCPDTVAV